MATDEVILDTQLVKPPAGPISREVPLGRRFSVGGVLGTTFSVWWRHVLAFTALSFVVYAPFGVTFGAFYRALLLSPAAAPQAVQSPDQTIVLPSVVPPAPVDQRNPATRPASFPTAAPDPNEIRITGIGKGSVPWTIVVLLTFLTLIPSLLLCMTPFARLLVVFHFLRQARHVNLLWVRNVARL